MLDATSWALLGRLTRWLDQFKSCFGHRAQRVSLREYIDGLLGDSPRKSMQAMLARVTEPRSYQAFQHFITHAPWNAQAVWRRLLEVIPDRAGVLILDDTPFLKQGTHSVGVGKQYVSTLKKIANCQVAVTAALWTGTRAWLLGAELYLPNFMIQTEVEAGATNLPARAVLHRILLESGRPLSWQWFSSPTTGQYVLNLHSVSQTASARPNP